MNGQFLQGLSEGIFERMGQLRQEQQRKDDEQKMQTIQLLTGLAGQVEPESIPALMGHLGDVIGIKGKMRGFWNAFSGMPDRSVADQLGTKLNEISSQFAGPATAKTVRASADMARLFQPQTPEQQANQANRLQAERDLQGKMIFRDPRAEKLQDLRETYGLKAAQSEAMLQERERLLRERQTENDQRDFQNAWKLRQQSEDLRTQRVVNARAYQIAVSNRRRVPSDEDLNEAVKQIADERGLNQDLLRARIGLTEARTDQTEAQTKVAQVRAGRLAAGAVNQGVKSSQMQKAVQAFEGLKQSLAEATQRGDAALMAALRKRLNTMAVNISARFGDKVEVGGFSSGWPYVKLRTAQAPAGPTLPPTVETLPGGIRLTTPGPTLNERQRAIFDDIKRERPDAADTQILDYMRKKGWL